MGRPGAASSTFEVTNRGVLFVLEECDERIADGILEIARFGEGAVEEGNALLDLGLEFAGLPPEEVLEADREQTGGRCWDNLEDDVDGFDGTGERGLDIVEGPGIDQPFRGVYKRVLSEGVARFEAGGGLQVLLREGNCPVEDDLLHSVLLGDGCGCEQAGKGAEVMGARAEGHGA